jgi:predicted metal-dependent enzyme (double-stranded beta helix superfamily)
MSSEATGATDEELSRALLEELLRDTNGLIARARDLFVPRRGRAWIRVADTPGADAWLIAWSRGSSVGTHDHGGSHGAFHVLRGALVESYRDSEEPYFARVRRLADGATVSIPPDRVHDVANAGARRALSLHVYAPRLTAMTFYSGAEPQVSEAVLPMKPNFDLTEFDLTGRAVSLR